MRASKAAAAAGEIDRILILMGLLKADDYDVIAKSLGDVLLAEWDEAVKEAIRSTIRLLKEIDGPVSAEQKEAAVNEISVKLGPAFSGRVAAPLYQAHYDAFELGQKKILHSATLSFNVVDKRALEALDSHNIYAVRGQFDNNLRKTVMDLGKRIISEGLTGRQAGDLFEDELAEQFQQYGTKYWRGFANHVVTRSRSIGQTNAYEKAEIEFYQIRAVLDHRTTEICRHMHGRVIPVKRAAALRDKLLEAKTPDEVKEIAPWVKEDVVKDKTSDKLDVGMMLPPYHFNCRTRTIAMSGDRLAAWQKASEIVKGGTGRQREIAVNVVEQAFGKSILKANSLKKIGIGITREEIAGRMLDCTGCAGLCYGHPDLGGPVAVLVEDGNISVVSAAETWDESKSHVLYSGSGFLFHELGHAILAMCNIEKYHEIRRKLTFMKSTAVSSRAEDGFSERFAENFCAFMTSNRRMKKDFPDDFAVVKEVADHIGVTFRPFGFKGE